MEFFHNIFFPQSKELILSQVWWRYTPVIPILGRLWLEDLQFEANLGHMARLCFKKQKEYIFFIDNGENKETSKEE
jgi:hypothetical protein